MRYVAVGNQNRTPLAPSGEARGADDQRPTDSGGISLAAVLGGTLLRWRMGTPDTPPRRMAPRP